MALITRRTAILGSLALATTPGAAFAQDAGPPANTQQPGGAQSATGRITIRQTQAAFIGSVSWGRGTLAFRGRRYGFRVRGLGAGGIGYATMTATGEVFNLTRVQDFPGAYAQARAGAVLGDQQLQGGLWLTNANGVRIQLRPQRAGLALQLGGDALVIEMTR